MWCNLLCLVGFLVSGKENEQFGMDQQFIELSKKIVNSVLI
jgi:hypothetical protein